MLYKVLASVEETRWGWEENGRKEGRQGTRGASKRTSRALRGMPHRLLVPIKGIHVLLLFSINRLFPEE